ncbi:acyltransferase [Vibrio lentus]|nr:acyltransferase [Vibrio lentus]
MDKLINTIFILITNTKSLLLIFKTNFAMKVKLPLLSLHFPSVRIRKGGSIKIGSVRFRNGVSFFSDGGRIKIGDGCFFNNDCSVNSMGSIDIGESSIFGEGVRIYDHNHRISSDYLVSKEVFDVAPVVIGKNCWLGSNVVILAGVSICDRVVVGAGTIISKNIKEPGVYISRSKGLIKIK